MFKNIDVDNTDDHNQESEQSFKFSGAGQFSEIKTLPSVDDVLNRWIEQDFNGSQSEFLNAFDLKPDDFYNTSIAAGYEDKYGERSDLFGDVIGGVSALGKNLGHLLNQFVPDTLFQKGLYKSGSSYADIHSFIALQFYQGPMNIKAKAHHPRQVIDIDEETFVEKLELARQNKTVINKNQIAESKDIKAFRDLLNARIDDLYNRVQAQLPHDQKDQVTKLSFIQKIAESVHNINPWELFAYTPMKKRRSTDEIMYIDKNGGNYHSYYYLKEDDIINTLSDYLYSHDKEDDEERKAFFNVASKVIGKQLPLDFEGAILNGPDIPLEQIYKYTRLSLGVSRQELVDNFNLKRGSIATVEADLSLNPYTLKCLNAAFKFDQRPNILAKLEIKIKEKKARNTKRRVQATFKKQRNNTPIADQNKANFLLKEWRCLTLGLSLQGLADIFNHKKSFTSRLESGETKSTIAHIDKICKHLGQTPNYPHVKKIIDAIEREEAESPLDISL